MRVAVVGAGAAGLCSALALSEFGYHVTVYERSASVGGHATTREVLGKRHLRDPAFGVFRRRQWPNFQALLATLGVEPISLGQCQDWFDSPFIGWFHEGGAPLQRDPEVMREGQRFTAALARSLRDPEADGRTVGELIEELSLSQDFVNTWFMGGAILYFGGHPTQRYLDYPLRLVAWMWESSVGQGTSEPLELLRVRDAEYMQAFTSYLASRGVHIRTRTQARLVQRDEGGVHLECAHDDGELTHESFGQLVLAIQPHQALEVLGEQRSEDERRILSGFEHTLDTVVVHEDAAYLPADPEQRKLASIRLPAADAAPATAAATLPYTLSVPCDRDQHTPVLATYDYAHADAWGEEVERFTFSHTVVTPKTQALRRELAQLQGRGSVHYAGSWLRGLTLHEDAVVTGLAAANRILGPNSEFRVLPAPLELPAPFEAMPEADATEGAGFLGGIDSTRAALQEVLRAVLGIDAAELGADADVQALGMSSLQVARLANAINADLPATATEQVDVAMLLQMETLAELVDYVHATAQGEAASAAGRGDAPPEPPRCSDR